MSSRHIAMLIDIDRFDLMESYYRDQLEVIDCDGYYVLAVKPVELEKYDHTDRYFLGDQITNFSDMWNLWIDTSGKAYFVPWWSHNFAAHVLWNEYADDLEAKGWIHISDSHISNYRAPKVNDRQYNTLALYCEHNNRPMFSNIL